MNLTEQVVASSVNPFDHSYNQLQQKFDNLIVHLLLEILNLNLTLVKAPLVTNLEAYKKDPDSWLLEQIVNGSAQISTTSIILTPDTQTMCHYSFGISTFRPQLFYKARSLRDDKNIYVTPFSNEVWLYIISVFILIIIEFTFILKIEEKLPHKIPYDVLLRIKDLQERDKDWSENLQNTSDESLHQREKWELSEILLFCLGILCQQGSSRDPSTSAARTLLIFVFMLAVVFYTAYSASIISLVTLLPSTEIEGTGKLINFSGRFTTLLYENNLLKEEQKLNIPNIKKTNSKEGFDKALSGQALFIGDRDASLTFFHAQSYPKELKCKLGRAFLGIEYHRVFVFNKNFKYKENMNINSILRLRDSGLLKRERQKIFTIKAPCTYTEKTSSYFFSFNKNDVQPIMNFLKIGVAGSILLIILENIVYYW